MLNENIKILAASPTHRSYGKSFALGAMLERMQEAKESGTFMITDCKGEVLRAFRSSDIQIYHVVQSIDQAAAFGSNNWRKMHGYPLRRKMYNKANHKTRRKWDRNRTKQRRPICVRIELDEIHKITAYQVGYEAD